jgi:hypothetical protein
LFDENDNTFMLSCCIDKTTNQCLIISRCRDAHLRSYADMARLLLNGFHADFVAVLRRDRSTALSFQLLGSIENYPTQAVDNRLGNMLTSLSVDICNFR